jgi:CrcB protein
MHHVLLIALGGALGALGRYWVAGLVHGVWAASWPLATLLINASGSLLIGIVVVALERLVWHPEWRSILMVGFLGAFTTFSTFSLETVDLWMRGNQGMALAYALSSTVACIAAAAIGVLVARSVLGH